MLDGKRFEVNDMSPGQRTEYRSENFHILGIVADFSLGL